jgi:preprotein translocase subunit SecE
MSKEGNTAVNPLWRELFSAGLYKPSQGRIARQASFGAIAALIALGCWSLYSILIGSSVAPAVRFGVPGGLLLVGVWFAYRLVNMPKFADFLIAVEAEMNKVSWPTKTELVRSSIVVMVTIFGMMTVLYFFDVFWGFLLRALGVLGGTGGG